MYLLGRVYMSFAVVEAFHLGFTHEWLIHVGFRIICLLFGLFFLPFFFLVCWLVFHYICLKEKLIGFSPSHTYSILSSQSRLEPIHSRSLSLSRSLFLIIRLECTQPMTHFTLHPIPHGYNMLHAPFFANISNLSSALNLKRMCLASWILRWRTLVRGASFKLCYEILRIL